GEPCGPPLRLRLHAGLARRARRAPAQAPAAAAGRRLINVGGAAPLPLTEEGYAPLGLPWPTPPTGHAPRSPSEFPIGGPRRASSPREPAQPAHGDDAERRSEREGRERPRPPGPTDERGNQPDRRRR